MRYLASLLLAGLAGATLCGPPGEAVAAAGSRQYLDQRTAATVRTTLKPLVFARERTAVAVNARDYFSLSAVDVNRGGQHALYWYAYIWSTIDEFRKDKAAPMSWVLLADGRPIPLRGLDAAPGELGIGEPPLPLPKRNARVVLFAVDAEMLQYVAAAMELRLQSLDGRDDFAIWRDARPELQAFLAEVSR